MSVSVNFSALRRTKWYEYTARLLFGGAVTALAGFLAQHFGPVIGGLFLAFPAIFPASATLVEKHERAKKQKAGIQSTIRGRQAAAVDAYGAAMGCLGLMCFAGIVWKLLPGHNPSMVLFAATAAWFGVSIGIWLFRKSRFCHSR